MTIRLVAISFDGQDANPQPVRSILGSTAQVNDRDYRGVGTKPDQKLIEADDKSTKK